MDNIRFPDFTRRPEGGAAALRQTVRAFAAAGLPNRSIALFDNDTAARDVTRMISDRALPDNIRVTHLPTLDMAKNYPTGGPQGHRNMDVDGLAGSIEAQLESRLSGVMADELTPVHWRGYFAKLQSYQGELAHKNAVQDAFRTKATRTSSMPSLMSTQDWRGIDLVVEHLLQELTSSQMNKTPLVDADWAVP